MNFAGNHESSLNSYGATIIHPSGTSMRLLMPKLVDIVALPYFYLTWSAAQISWSRREENVPNCSRSIPIWRFTRRMSLASILRGRPLFVCRRSTRAVPSRGLTACLYIDAGEYCPRKRRTSSDRRKPPIWWSALSWHDTSSGMGLFLLLCGCTIYSGFI